jgi:cytochrome c
MHRLALLTIPGCFLLGTLSCGESHDDAPRADSGAGGVSTSSTGGTALPAAGTSGSLLPQGAAAGSLAGTNAGAGNGGANGGDSAGRAGSDALGEGASLLVFSRTAAYRHDSIAAGVKALTQLASERGWQLAATEDASKFSDAGLASYNVVVFLSTTGDVLDDAQQAAFERFIRSGKGFIGIHSATDTEYDWPWYGELVGAYFREHPMIQAADVIVEDAQNPATAQLPTPWRRSDEWYAFQSNPRANVHVLLSLDETSYTPGVANMSGDHPIAWCHEYDGGRAFYTALGHTSESYADPLFVSQLAGAVSWVIAH